MVELLKQPQYQPMDVIDEVLSIYAGTKGYLDSIPIGKVRVFEKEMLKFFHEKYPDVYNSLKEKAELTSDIEEKIKAAIIEFKASFKA
jgi:F-type H+-transporting ATPase subunit alpha